MIRFNIEKGTKVFNTSVGCGEFVQWLPSSSSIQHIALIKTIDGKYKIPRSELTEIEE